jgi:hypothetical protein
MSEGIAIGGLSVWWCVGISSVVIGLRSRILISVWYSDPSVMYCEVTMRSDGTSESEQCWCDR